MSVCLSVRLRFPLYLTWMRKEQWRHRVISLKRTLCSTWKWWASPFLPSPPPSPCPRIMTLLKLTQPLWSLPHTLSWSSPIHYVFLTITFIETDHPQCTSNIVSIMTSSLSAHTLVMLSRRQWHGQRVGVAVIRGVGSAWVESWSWDKEKEEVKGGMERLTISTSNIVSSWVISHGVSIAPSSSKSSREGTST